MVDKHTKLETIFALYDRPDGGTVELDPVVAAMTDDDVQRLLDDWDPGTVNA